ncbi:hypothetical protein [Tumebacillus lipolyticus]|uniref:DUF302 domain-containing protein n=1 Tax=Tumebacillus lipolyticus TaxID=1280370 RepID=A0ABW4ZYN3_9BACL
MNRRSSIFTLIIIGIILIYFFIDPFSNKLSDPEKITIYYEKEKYDLPSDNPIVPDLVSLVEEALDDVKGTYKGIRETPAQYTDSVQTMVFKVNPGTIVRVSPSDTGSAKLQPELVVLPLQGADYEQSQVITVGDENGLRMYRTSRATLEEIKELIDGYLSEQGVHVKNGK